jgi:hypothetical protein
MAINHHAVLAQSVSAKFSFFALLALSVDQ